MGWDWWRNRGEWVRGYIHPLQQTSGDSLVLGSVGLDLVGVEIRFGVGGFVVTPGWVREGLVSPHLTLP